MIFLLYTGSYVIENEENTKACLKKRKYVNDCQKCQILHKKKVIFIQLQESPIHPSCSLLLCQKQYSRA